MPEPSCHYCEQPADAQCPSCGRLYCPEHGDDICVRCMAPEAGVASAALYRGSIAALVVGTALAIFLIVSPPEDRASGDEVRVVSTPTPTQPAPTSTREPSDATSTPQGEPTATPTLEATEEPQVTTYTVVAGDTPSQIAADHGISLPALQAANPDVNFNPLAVGTVLVIPEAGE